MAGKPNKIDLWETMEFLDSLDSRLLPWLTQLTKLGWRFYLTDQTRGRAQSKFKTITVPKWVLKKDKGFQTYYMAHEMAHVFAFQHGPDGWDHGPIFMEELKKVCPPECIHHELGYKPRNAAAAGISSTEGDSKWEL